MNASDTRPSSAASSLAMLVIECLACHLWSRTSASLTFAYDGMRRQNSPPSSSRCARLAGGTGGRSAAGAAAAAGVGTMASLLSDDMRALSAYHFIRKASRVRQQQRQLGA